ncbi:hypothetical protein IAW_05832 [Bacillus cereus str. Schrouff]|uniref:YopX family protein n=1 Tax=Bacillus cereus TaxID=1396 RepID=UPI00032FDA1A|nr:YopX family protein [Bacillus cereus]EOO05013.1 hypothetical protein IAW_05832 [Bacillus cereus str. Schrouff]EOO81653.1 hypothetical protein IGY_05675 [Bacillus cereus K-5975c]
MRDFQFRGKFCDGTWVYGSHVQTGVNMHYIIPQNVIADEIKSRVVDKKTVGQYTGLTDKNGKRIYEGDIIRFKDKNLDSVEREEISFNDGGFGTEDWWLRDIGECEVIGNIYENPELLEENEMEDE